ncbi:hypothetical protein OHA70_14930 [Kribbella sp. NBC_00382]|uniref:hypothetical protein n=1 Tax=Kribbella sp. NBC_00382 TaxID=2975967 RepID=UPI002E21ACAF
MTGSTGRRPVSPRTRRQSPTAAPDDGLPAVPANGSPANRPTWHPNHHTNPTGPSHSTLGPCLPHRPASSWCATALHTRPTPRHPATGAAHASSTHRRTCQIGSTTYRPAGLTGVLDDRLTDLPGDRRTGYRPAGSPAYWTTRSPTYRATGAPGTGRRVHRPYWTTRSPTCRATGAPGYRPASSPAVPSDRLTDLLGYGLTDLLGYGLTDLLGYGLTDLPGAPAYRMAGLPAYRPSWWPDRDHTATGRLRARRAWTVSHRLAGTELVCGGGPRAS